MSRKTVLVLLSSGDDFAMQKFGGIQQYADAADWHLQLVEYSEGADGSYRLSRSPSGSDVSALIDFWHPDGCIADCGRCPELVRATEFGRSPTVFIERPPARSRGPSGFVYSDAESIAASAARELLYSGYANFVYFPFVEDTSWSRERGRMFRKFIEDNRKRLVEIGYPKGMTALDGRFQTFVSEAVAALPLPCGVFAANDLIAEAVVIACAGRRLSVPDDVAVIGVDNMPWVCENTQPSLSSVGRNFSQAGRTAAELLSEMMVRPQRGKWERTYASGDVVRRASTRFVKGGDRRVTAALEFIRRHACEGIGPLDVVAELGCSRRLADLLFTRVLGRTILDEIHEVRLARVRELLKNPRTDYAAIPDFCGYTSLVDLRRDFKKRVGLTMGEYRRSLN